MSKAKSPCPCGSQKPYASCCLPLHQGQAAQTPEALMRSRFSAYVFKLEAYLLATWHPDTRPGELDLNTSPKWARLQIVSSQHSEQQGQVHFKAFYRSSRGMQCMEEKSEFIYDPQAGRWLYLSGQQIQAR